MSRRSRRATEPVSSSASMTTRPPTMCRPPEKRSSAVTSALRSEVFVHSTRESSSLTIAVIAMCGVPFPLVPTAQDRKLSSSVPIPDRTSALLPRPDHGGQRGGQAHGIVPWRTIELGDGTQHELRPELTYRRKETTA